MAGPSIPVRGFGRGCAIAAACSLVLLSGCSSSPRPQAAPAKAATLSVGCSAQVAPGKLLPAPRPVTATVPGAPTAMVGTPDGRWAFASLSKDASQTAGQVMLANFNSRHGRRVSRTRSLSERDGPCDRPLIRRGTHGPGGRRRDGSAGEDLVQGGGEGVGLARLAVFAAEESAVAAGEGDGGRAEPSGHGQAGAARDHLAGFRADPDHDAGRGGAERV